MTSSTGQRAIIIGAGPAGLTAGLELLRRTGIKPILLEASQEIGGISRTIRYKGNRMDIGGHRFFSKSDRVMKWWMDLLPPVAADDAGGEAAISYQGKPARYPPRPLPQMDRLLWKSRPKPTRPAPPASCTRKPPAIRTRS